MDNKFTPNENNLKNVQELIDWSFERIANRYGSFSPMHIRGSKHLMHFETKILPTLRKGIIPEFYHKEVTDFMNKNRLALNNEYDGFDEVYFHHIRILEYATEEEEKND